jgi:hypothetical protein
MYVSDHAVLRYLERVKGIDIEAIRAELSTPTIDVAAQFGCDTIKRGDGSRMKLQGDVVSTVLGKRHQRMGI